MHRATLIWCLLLCVGCEKEQEQVKNETLAVWRDYADAVATIKSASDLDAAKPRLQDVGSRISRLKKRMKDLPVAEQDKVEADTKASVTAQQQRLSQEMNRIRQAMGMGAVQAIAQTVQVEAHRVNPY